MNKKYLFISVLLTVFICIMACSKDDEEDYERQNSEKQNDNDEESGDNSSEDQYYFNISNASGHNYGKDAGSTSISFKCNQNWSLTHSGNITGFSISPTSGNGSGSVKVKYSKAATKTSGNYIVWDEKETIIFHIKEGNKKNPHNTTKEFVMRRYGKQIKP